MRLILALGLLLSVTLQVDAQSLWKSINQETLTNQSTPDIAVDQYAVFELDFSQFQRSLENTPQEDLTNASAPGKTISLPLPDGEVGRFKIWETSIFHPNTAATYPQLRSYRGIGLDDKNAAVRMAISPKGVHLALSLIHISEPTRPY